MKMILVRTIFTPDYTEGVLLLNDRFYCYTLEDTVRTGPKVPGKTAIQAGTYKVKLSLSNRFKKVLPELLNVPNFAGVRMHGGNTSEDTEGCILVAVHRISPGVIQGSLAATLVQDLTPGGLDHEIQIVDVR